MKAVQWTVFIDMLGFKKLNTAVTSDEQAQELLEFMVTNRDVLVEYEKAMVQGYQERDGFNPYEWYDVKSACISDSIVVTFKPKEVVWETNAERVLMHSANTLMLLSIRLGLLMNKCLLQKKITFRGGISIGYCDINDSFAVGAGLSAASEAEGKAKSARLALADDVLRNEKLMKMVRWLFKAMYGDTEFLVKEKDVIYVNILDLMLAAADPKSPSVARSLRSAAGRGTAIRARIQCEEYLTAQKKLVIESIQEFWEAYRKNYSDKTLRAVNRGVLKKYFWLRKYHNSTAKKRGYVDFCI